MTRVKTTKRVSLYLNIPNTGSARSYQRPPPLPHQPSSPTVEVCSFTVDWHTFSCVVGLVKINIKEKNDEKKI